VIGDAGADNASPDDDDVCCLHVFRSDPAF
jgi:hypothetical protein